MESKKLTVRNFRQLYKSGQPIVCLTGYDALMARMQDECGIDLILVGDSLGMTMLGYSNTIPVTMEQSLHHTAAVARVVKRAFVIGDMPFMSYQINPDEAVRNAGRYVKEAGADGIKLEGGSEMASTISRIVKAGIPVMGHVGLMPQHVIAEGGYRTHGKNDKEAKQILADALSVQEAGAFSVVIEGVVGNLATEITNALNIPTIGIGAGVGCSGQVQVSHDILGMFETFVPKHTRRYANLAMEMRKVFEQYKKDVTEKSFPGKDETLS